MIIKVNGKVIENADWRIKVTTGELRFETNEGIKAIEDIYNPDKEVVIEEYNDDLTLKAQWYMRKLISVTYKQNEDTLNWELQVEFEMSADPISEIDDIKESAEDTDGGLLEIAAMVSDMCDEQAALESAFAIQQGTLNNLSDLYETLADRVAKLENK